MGDYSKSVQPDDWTYYLPFIFQQWTSVLIFVFYIVFEISSRRWAAARYPDPPSTASTSSPQQANDASGLKERNRPVSIAEKRDIVGRWLPSWVHAVMCVATSVMWLTGIVADSKWMVANTYGYFIADLIVDHDPGYVLHHVGPCVVMEIMLRTGCSLHYTTYCGAVAEAGNVISHTASLVLFRSGPIFDRINFLCFYLSRPASCYYACLSWMYDIPAYWRWRWPGILIAISYIVVYGINLFWMIEMVLPRNARKEHKESASVVAPAKRLGQKRPHLSLQEAADSSSSNGIVRRTFVLAQKNQDEL